MQDKRNKVILDDFRQPRVAQQFRLLLRNSETLVCNSYGLSSLKLYNVIVFRHKSVEQTEEKIRPKRDMHLFMKYSFQFSLLFLDHHGTQKIIYSQTSVTRDKVHWIYIEYCFQVFLLSLTLFRKSGNLYLLWFYDR